MLKAEIKRKQRGEMDEESNFCILVFSIKDAGNTPSNGWNAHTFGCPDLLSTHSRG